MARQAAKSAGAGIRELAQKTIYNLVATDCQPPAPQNCYEVEVPNVEWQMNRLGSKMPAIRGLEKKLDLMNELKPELGSLINDINKITDTSDLVRARQGGAEIKRMLSAQG